MAALCLGLALCSNCFADDYKALQYKDAKLEYEYPQFTLKDASVNKKINQVLEAKFTALKEKQSKDKNLVAGNLRFDVELNNEKYISMYYETFTDRGEPRGWYETEYFVFDKKNGKRMKYTDFVPALSLKELKWGVSEHRIPLEFTDGSISEGPFLYKKLTQNFKLNEDGSICLVYDPIDQDAEDQGNVNVRLTKKSVRELKRLYRNKEASEEE